MQLATVTRTQTFRCNAFAVKQSKTRASSRVIVRAAMPEDSNKVFNAVKNVTLSIAAAAVLSLATPAISHAKLDTDTYKAGVGATIEASPIQNDDARKVVDLLKNKVLPEVEAKLKAAADKSGSSYPDSVVQELKTVRSEIDALEKQIDSGDGGGLGSNIKSVASGIEQQINALKATMGFD